MPSASLKHLADKAGVSMERAEHLWNKAKGIVSNEYGSREKVKGYWAIVMGITKKMMGMKESLTFKEFLMSKDDETLEEMGPFGRTVRVVKSAAGDNAKFAGKSGKILQATGDHSMYFVDFGEDGEHWIQAKYIEVKRHD